MELILHIGLRIAMVLYKPPTREQAAKAYDVLVEYGAPKGEKFDLRVDDFVFYMTDGDKTCHKEWRFMGMFGFSGKCRWTNSRGFYADYAEGKTTLKDQRMKDLNEKLQKINNDA